MDNIKITYTTEVTPQMLEDLLVTALGGATGYWACLDLVAVTAPNPDGRYKQYKDRKADDWVPEYIHIPMSEGGIIPIIDAETVDDDEPEVLGTLTLNGMSGGLQLMAAQYPKDFREFIDGDYDANTADCFMQLAVLGDVVYG